MGKLLHQLGGTVGIVAKKLRCAAGGLLNRQRAPTAGALFGQLVGTAFGEVFRNLRDNHVGLVDLNGVAHAELKLLEDIVVVQISPAYSRAVHLHRLKQAGDAHHAGSGSGKLHAEKLGGVQFVFPFEGDQTVLMVTGRSQALAIGSVVVLHDEAVHREGEVGGIVVCNSSVDVSAAR